ncbi:MAG: glutathione S-transferase, partial [Haliea sp.]
MLKLYIANKNYSSWSMRPWVLLKQAGIPFEEVMVRFGDDPFNATSGFKQAVLAVSPGGRVPVLVDGGFAIWDTLAIAEYVAEQFPDRHLWPADVKARARARSVCAEMHSGFGALRNACPMNIEADLSRTGAIVWRDQPAVRSDVERIVTMWAELLDQHRGPRTAGPPQGANAPSGGRETG